jgi:hypothetical protein
MVAGIAETAGTDIDVRPLLSHGVVADKGLIPSPDPMDTHRVTAQGPGPKELLISDQVARGDVPGAIPALLWCLEGPTADPGPSGWRGHRTNLRVFTKSMTTSRTASSRSSSTDTSLISSRSRPATTGTTSPRGAGIPTAYLAAGTPDLPPCTAVRPPERLDAAWRAAILPRRDPRVGRLWADALERGSGYWEAGWT